MCNTYGDKNILLVGQIKESNVKIPMYFAHAMSCCSPRK